MVIISCRDLEIFMFFPRKNGIGREENGIE